MTTRKKPPRTVSLVRSSAAEYLTFVAASGGGGVEAVYADENVWLSQEIRISERKFYQKITDIYATAVDYDVTAQATKRFFAMVQNKLHWAIHGQTAAEVIYDRADANEEYLGLHIWADAALGKIQKFDVVVVKNYLTEDELVAAREGAQAVLRWWARETAHDRRRARY